MLRLHERHEQYCEAGIMAELPDFDDFHMAAISWVVAREWDNPLLSDQVKVVTFIQQFSSSGSAHSEVFCFCVCEAKYPEKCAFGDISFCNVWTSISNPVNIAK